MNDRPAWRYDAPETYWEKVAETNWGKYISGVEYDTLLRALRLIERPARALEIGCEGGRWSRVLSGDGWNVTATDVDPTVLSLCKARNPSVNCILVKPTDTTLPCETKSVDLVVAIEPDVAMQSDWILAEVNRVLKDSGIFVSLVWNNMSWRGFIPHIRCSLKGVYDYYTFSYREWKNKFTASGLDIIYSEGLCWMPFSRHSNSPMIPLGAKLEKMLGLRKLTYVSPWISLIAKKR
jgi:SAM-dependent methyltransferase